MKNIDFIDFKNMVDSAINAGKDSLSFQIYGCSNGWVVEMTDKLCEEEDYYRNCIDKICGAEILFKE